MAALLLLLASCFIAVASAQNPCCAPHQFEGLMSTFLSPNSTYREAFAKLSYDYTNQLVSSNDTLVGSHGAMRQHVLINGKSRIMYIVDHHSRECRIIGLSSGLDPPCIPNHFRSDGTFHFGAGSGRLDFTSFRGRIADLDALVSTTRSGCVPISQMVHSDRHREIQSFVNITLGIRDRRVFTVPPECRRSDVRVLHPTVGKLRSEFPILRSLFLVGHY